jgi:hypothetical protein
VLSTLHMALSYKKHVFFRMKYLKHNDVGSATNLVDLPLEHSLHFYLKVAHYCHTDIGSL